MGLLGSVISGVGDVVTGNWGGLVGDVVGAVGGDDGGDSGGGFGDFFRGLFNDAGDAVDNMKFDDWRNLLGTGIAGYSAYSAAQQQKAINDAQQQMFGQNLSWQGQSQQNAFGHDATMATAQMAFQDYQSKTQYQRAMEDMGAAGLNPILAASRGGNAAQSGSAPVSGGSGGSSIPQLGNKVTAGLAGAASAASIQNLVEQNNLLRATRDRTEAETETERNRPENVRTDTAYKTSSAAELDARAKKIMLEVKDLIPALAYESTARAALHSIDYNLREEQTLTEVDRRRLIKARTLLAQLEQPEASAYAEMYKTPFGTKIPYIREGERFVSSATGAYRDLSGAAQRKRFNDIIENKPTRRP
jgi:hypothetical protein